MIEVRIGVAISKETDDVLREASKRLGVSKGNMISSLLMYIPKDDQTAAVEKYNARIVETRAEYLKKRKEMRDLLKLLTDEEVQAILASRKLKA